METLFGILTTQQWLAILRIGIGLWWIKSVWHKEYPKFVQTGMMNWTNALLDNHPWPAYANFQRKIINFQPKLFPYLIVLGELAVGIGLTLGIPPPIRHQRRDRPRAVVAPRLRFGLRMVRRPRRNL